MMVVFKSLVPIFHNNQSFLPVSLKIKPKKKLSVALGIENYMIILIKNKLDLSETEVKFKVDKVECKDTEMMEGFYLKRQLRCFFEERKKM